MLGVACLLVHYFRHCRDVVVQVLISLFAELLVQLIVQVLFGVVVDMNHNVGMLCYIF
jgi:hypothetical protein